ncbi:hypothetical protein ACQU0X_28910 [Pseudovibrio ascidiaceicola]|uniref:hypothetical protein n=1 Tax=Pseudovibrio ascidiaceicola TaxID=285279 RepID=UPI003D36F2BF
MSAKEPRFWMVWNPQGSDPRYRHNTRRSADEEASRLARQNPGQEFFVLKAVGGSKAPHPTAEQIKITSSTDEIPF